MSYKHFLFELSIVAAGAVLPRPLAMVSGLAITGFQMVREVYILAKFIHSVLQGN